MVVKSGTTKYNADVSNIKIINFQPKCGRKSLILSHWSIHLIDEPMNIAFQSLSLS